jgi:4-hydroxy 2-oxovalerate aldolase
VEYQKRNIDDRQAVSELRELCRGREILILAPGKSLLTYKKEVSRYIEKNHPVIFAVNHIPEYYPFDRVFISNLKRFRDVNDAVKRLKGQAVCTSNILVSEDVTTINYSNYLNEDDAIVDNAGLMVINLLRKAGVTAITLAGYDGFNYLSTQNYYDDKMINGIQYEKQEQINRAVTTYFEKLKKSIKVTFVTPTIYDGSRKDE